MAARRPSQVARLVLVALSAVTGCGGERHEADLVLRGGRIVTLDEAVPEAEALAIVGGRIAAVGGEGEIAAWIGSGTEVLDLDGGLAVPGFIESHGHLEKLGRLRDNLDLSQAGSWEEIVEQVRLAAQAAEPGRWIYGRGWHQDKWTVAPEPAVRGFPVHDALSRVTPDNPVHLQHASGHASIDNLRAMQIAGIDSETPDPPGGEILRRSDGSPAGVFLENAQAALYEAYEASQETPEGLRRMLEVGAAECIRKGVTSFHQAGLSLRGLDVLKHMVDDGALDLRIYAMIDSEDPDLTARATAYRVVGYGDDHLTIRAIKAYVDGALGSRGAWLLLPYEDLPESSGQVVHPIEEIEGTARFARDNDFQLCVHAIGDRGNREMLDLYERVLGTASGVRWRIEHAQHVDPADVPRFAGLGVVASMQPVHCISDGPWVPARIGDARARDGAYRWRALLDSGAVVVSGTDTPVEDVDPIPNFHAAVTRRLADGASFYPEQRMTREEALRSYTLDAAWAAFEEDLKGSLTPGKLADVTVLSKDILTVPEDEILEARVLYTVVGGKVVYAAADPDR
jgi:predicted amidohydrolase YtcJ